LSNWFGAFSKPVCHERIERLTPWHSKKNADGAQPRSSASLPTGCNGGKIVWGPPLRWLGVLLVVAAVGYGVQIGSERLREPGAFPLRYIQTEGEWRNLVKADVHAVAEAYIGQNFFVANLDELNTALATNPWIETVAVRRWWPDTVEISLRERTAFGYWGEREMVDVNGVRFQPTIVRQAGPWPRLVGPDGHEKALIEAYRQTRALLDPLGLKLITVSAG
jgi:cell division protein FtsQ